MTKLHQGIQISDGDTLQLFFYGKDFYDSKNGGEDDKADKVLTDCISIIGSLSSPSSLEFQLSSLTVEFSDFALKITKDNRAYEFSSIVRPNLQYAPIKNTSTVYDGSILLVVENYLRTCSELAKNVAAILRRRGVD
jgi:hypothetical protein